MSEITTTDLGTAALAIGALGGASQGIVDGLFKSLRGLIRPGLSECLRWEARRTDGGSFRRTRPHSIHYCLH